MLHIDQGKCLGCGRCMPYCNVEAISLIRLSNGRIVAQVDLGKCLECNVCYRAKVCTQDALDMREIEYPRSVRLAFSDPLVEHKDTGVPGRGTEEGKTNDVTGRFRRGCVGIAIEMGRPGVGSTLRDVEKVAMAMAELGAEFEPRNPVTGLMIDREKGLMRPEVLDERVLSAIIEFIVKADETPSYLRKLQAVAKEIDTVFSLVLITRCEPDGTAPTVALARQAGLELRPNGKTNIGLGRPRFMEVDSHDTYIA